MHTYHLTREPYNRTNPFVITVKKNGKTVDTAKRIQLEKIFEAFRKLKNKYK